MRLKHLGLGVVAVVLAADPVSAQTIASKRCNFRVKQLSQWLTGAKARPSMPPPGASVWAKRWAKQWRGLKAPSARQQHLVKGIIRAMGTKCPGLAKAMRTMASVNPAERQRVVARTMPAALAKCRCRGVDRFFPPLLAWAAMIPTRPKPVTRRPVTSRRDTRVVRMLGSKSGTLGTAGSGPATSLDRSIADIKASNARIGPGPRVSGSGTGAGASRVAPRRYRWRVRLAKVSGYGAANLTRRIVRRTIEKRYLRRFRRCFRSAKRTGGKLDLRLRIAPSGRVKQAMARGLSPAGNYCIRRVARQMRFYPRPRNKTGKPVTARYRLVILGARRKR